MLCSVLGCKHGIGRLGFNQGWVMSGIYNRKRRARKLGVNAWGVFIVMKYRIEEEENDIRDRLVNREVKRIKTVRC